MKLKGDNFLLTNSPAFGLIFQTQICLTLQKYNYQDIPL